MHIFRVISQFINKATLILISYLNLSFKLKTNKESRKLEIYFKLCNRGQLIKKKKI